MLKGSNSTSRTKPAVGTQSSRGQKRPVGRGGGGGAFGRARFGVSSEAGSSLAISKAVEGSKTSGRLNLSNQNLSSIPEAVFSKSAPPPKSVDLSFDRRSDDQWWEVVDLSRLVIADNAIEDLDPRIGELDGLTVLDAHNNRLRHLPDKIGHLINLSILNLSGNSLSELPPSLFTLPLKDLNLSSNNISILPRELGELASLVVFDISSNSLSEVPSTVDRLSGLQKLNLSRNGLKTMGPADFSRLTRLQDLDASENALERTFSFNSGTTMRLPELLRLDLRKNRLRNLSGGTGEGVHCPKLRELLVSFNALMDVEHGWLENAAKLEVLDLAENALEAVPPGVLNLKELKRLDLTNNAIGKLPPELGTLTQLNILLITGNPLRGLPSSGGTTRLLQFLRDRIVDDAGSTAPANRSNSSRSTSGTSPPPTTQSDFTSSAQAATTRSVDMSHKSLSELDLSAVGGLPYRPSQLVLHHNVFTKVPNIAFELFDTLTTLVLSYNQISEFPTASLPKLKVLDLGYNSITTLPSIVTFPSLLDLNLTKNRISSLPSTFPFPSVETLILSGNSISVIDAPSFRKLSQLKTLDLSDNAIGSVPPELGLCEGLRTLKLEGNLFRVPRRAILEKGTDAVLAYLRDRIPM
ncbi:Leucine-rich repeat-containing protein 40 [Borealophlyctis nickersoniae]|nr:Leucine-rich repeat-containing protein 40 [Borealophlyctis nickersoniae]